MGGFEAREGMIQAAEGGACFRLFKPKLTSKTTCNSLEIAGMVMTMNVRKIKPAESECRREALIFSTTNKGQVGRDATIFGVWG